MTKDFETKKAFHAKQAAYHEMAKAREKMSTLQQIATQKYSVAESLQVDYDNSRAKQDAKWQSYNDSQLEMKDQIANKIVSVQECNLLEQNFKLMAENPDENSAKVEIYLEGAKFFAGMAMQKMVERDNLIAEKRNMPRPDNYESERILDKLKLARSEHAEALEDYHSAKNEFTVKKVNFDRLNERYKNLQSGKESTTYSNRPERLEKDERLLVKANIPEEYWDDCEVMRRADGLIDIYYGGGKESHHGHVVISDEKVEYDRKPQTTDDYA